MNKELLQQLNQKPIAYYPIYRAITGSTTAGILLSQLMYWFSKKDKIFKTDEDIRGEIYLTIDELKSAKNKIKKLDFITVTREGVPAKTYYEIDWEIYQTSLSNFLQLDGGNPTNCIGEIPQTIIVKSLTETTTENKNINTKRKTSYPENDNELKTYAIQKAASENIKCPIRTYEAFKDHHISVGSKFNDWSRAFNTWIRNFFKYETPNNIEFVCLKDANNLTGVYSFEREELQENYSGKLFGIKKVLFLQKIISGDITAIRTNHA